MWPFSQEYACFVRVFAIDTSFHVRYYFIVILKGWCGDYGLAVK